MLELKDELSKLRKQVENCRKCKLWKTRNESVFGEGPKDSKIVIIGFGPGYHENLEGRPFIGPSGKLLDDLLELARQKREAVYITNVMKCYLPNNKASSEEIRNCTPYLNKQIERIKPKIIVLLGNVATKYFFNKHGLPLSSMHDIHGKIFSVSILTFQTKLIPTYHPAAALRNPGLRDTLKIDWKKMGKLLRSNCLPSGVKGRIHRIQ